MKFYLCVSIKLNIFKVLGIFISSIVPFKILIIIIIGISKYIIIQALVIITKIINLRNHGKRIAFFKRIVLLIWEWTLVLNKVIIRKRVGLIKI